VITGSGKLVRLTALVAVPLATWPSERARPGSARSTTMRARRLLVPLVLILNRLRRDHETLHFRRRLVVDLKPTEASDRGCLGQLEFRRDLRQNIVGSDREMTYRPDTERLVGVDYHNVNTDMECQHRGVWWHPARVNGLDVHHLLPDAWFGSLPTY